MTTWNYRVVHRTHYGRDKEYDEEVYAVHEVYYDVNGKVSAVSLDPVPIWANDMKGLDWVLRKMREAYEKDVLEWDSIPDKTSHQHTVDGEPFGNVIDGE